MTSLQNRLMFVCPPVMEFSGFSRSWSIVFTIRYDRRIFFDWTLLKIQEFHRMKLRVREGNVPSARMRLVRRRSRRLFSLIVQQSWYSLSGPNQRHHDCHWLSTIPVNLSAATFVGQAKLFGRIWGSFPRGWLHRNRKEPLHCTRARYIGTIAEDLHLRIDIIHYTRVFKTFSFSRRESRFPGFQFFPQKTGERNCSQNFPKSSTRFVTKKQFGEKSHLR